MKTLIFLIFSLSLWAGGSQQMLISQNIVATGFSANATHFATSLCVATHSLGFTGAADGKTGIVSVWLKFSSGSGARKFIFRDGGGNVNVNKSSGDGFNIMIYEATANVVLALNLSSTATTLADGSWHHCVAAWDVSDSTKCHVVIDGTEGTTVSAAVNLNLEYTSTSWTFSYDDTTGLDADAAEFYWAPGQWLDLSSSTNVQKFRSSGGHPVSLGTDGSTPTGTSPLVYFKDPYSSFGTNSGTGGNFTTGGTLTPATAP